MLNGRRAAAALAATSLGLLAPAGAQAAETFYGVTDSNRLVTFQSDSPGAIRSSVPITGLADSDEGITGIDVRPADRGLYGTGSEGVLYRIDPATGVANPVGASAGFGVRGRSFGADFNPVADRLRLVSEAGMNARINPATGQGVTDANLAYAAGDPNAGRAPAVVAAAYTNNVAGATATELFGLDTTRDALVLQSPPDGGVLRTRGSLGFDAVSPAGFDIAGSDGRAWAAFRRAGKRDVGLYVLNVNTGRAFRAVRRNAIATYTGSKRDPLRALAAKGADGDDTTPPVIKIRRRSRTNVTDLLRGRALRLTVSYSEACTITTDLMMGKRRVGRVKSKAVGEAGRRAVRVKLTRRGRSIVRASGRARIRLRLNATDVAGNKTRRK
jgi:hypothetical protein